MARTHSMSCETARSTVSEGARRARRDGAELRFIDGCALAPHPTGAL